MKLKMTFVTVFLFFLFGMLQHSYASSSYVLPYPSTMPGGFTYKIHIVWEALLQYWYFGSFGQFAYNLKESDKYLVEAKTLFEYQQYLLGYTALTKSNAYFFRTLPNLKKAAKEGKDISENRNLLHQASLKHEEILEKMDRETPQTFQWSPEKSPSSTLQIHALIQQALQERQQYL